MVTNLVVENMCCLHFSSFSCAWSVWSFHRFIILEIVIRGHLQFYQFSSGKFANFSIDSLSLGERSDD